MCAPLSFVAFQSLFPRFVHAPTGPDWEFGSLHLTQDWVTEHPRRRVAMLDGMPVDQSAINQTPPSRVAHAPVYKRMPMTIIMPPPPSPSRHPSLSFPRNSHPVATYTTSTMADLTYNAGPIFGDMGVLGCPQDHWVDVLLRKLPALIIPHRFNVRGTPSYEPWT
jgi:hypothetical protein